MTIEAIQKNKVYQQVLADSCGGLVYNVGNRGKYDATEVLAIWDSIPEREQYAAGGIMKGAISFLKGTLS